MTERCVVSFTGDEIIRALAPSIQERLGPGTKHWTIVLTRWDRRALPPPDRVMPPGYSAMTVDVEFTLERTPEKEPS